MRARKKGLVAFEGEMLFQRRDDDKWIELCQNINTIRHSHGRDPDVVGGGEVVEWGQDEEDNKQDKPSLTQSTQENTRLTEHANKDSPKAKRSGAVNSIKSSFRKMARPFIKKRVADTEENSTGDEDSSSNWSFSRRSSRKSIPDKAVTNLLAGK